MNLDTRLQMVLCAVFGVPPERVVPEASPSTIESWDSVQHMHMVLALEAEFGVRFDPDEISDLTSVGAIRARLVRNGDG